MTNICLCSHPMGLHWFNSDRCIDCRCPGFYAVEPLVVAEAGISAGEREIELHRENPGN